MRKPKRHAKRGRYGAALAAVTKMRDSKVDWCAEEAASSIRWQLKQARAQDFDITSDACHDVKDAIDEETDSIGEMNELIRAMQSAQPWKDVVEWMGEASEDTLEELSELNRLPRRDRRGLRRYGKSGPLATWLGFWPDSYDDVYASIERELVRQKGRIV